MMTTFWIFAIIFVAITFALIWFPFFKKRLPSDTVEDVRQQANLEVYQEKLAFVEKDLVDGTINQEEFDVLKQELEITLLQDVKSAEQEQVTTKIVKRNPAWPLIMSITILSVTGYLYNKLGSYDIIQNVPTITQGHEGMTPEQMAMQQLMLMEQQVKENPKDSETWFSLGHAYMSLGRYDDSIHAFDQAIGIDGETAELLGPKATAMFYKNNQTMTPAIQSIIDKALKLDSGDPATLLLVGMNAFFESNYQQAITAWDKILNSERQDIDREAVKNAIAEAQNRLEHPPKPIDPNLGVEVEVTVADELKDKISPNDTLFVFARTSGDKIVPIAAYKAEHETFPTLLKLTQANELGTGVTFSDIKTVDIIALLSKNGRFKPEAGDLQGRAANVKVGGKVTLKLDTLISD
ncbi:c-type cytochrome biogenesis protein CcmI [Shewanella sp. 202IG2-18]|uniref:c-type cytochrome biogenesis protein CcmI n=1 Tax=Parashewanella hymeniacidonis TaxID=2807618 RepID=UPI0019607410|nr:c-type cytochrome biogenesis protein CcmI [Parashewanella hymeniacidonis]MBM7072978.1 c-type cytochrome biogenesis protein CcmI [Parashewanella hymeniacidonis]